MHVKPLWIPVAALLLAPLAAAAEPDRDRLELMLSDIERVPGKADLSRLGPGVDAVLRDIARSPNPARMLASTRAIAVLRHFPSPKTATVLRSLLHRLRQVTRPGVALINLQQALTSYAVVAGPAAMKEIEPLLSHSRIDVRHAACEAVRPTGSPQAGQVLRKRRVLERAPLVLHQIERQLRRIARPS